MSYIINTTPLPLLSTSTSTSSTSLAPTATDHSPPTIRESGSEKRLLDVQGQGVGSSSKSTLPRYRSPLAPVQDRTSGASTWDMVRPTLLRSLPLLVSLLLTPDYGRFSWPTLSRFHHLHHLLFLPCPYQCCLLLLFVDWVGLDRTAQAPGNAELC